MNVLKISSSIRADIFKTVCGLSHLRTKWICVRLPTPFSMRDSWLEPLETACTYRVLAQECFSISSWFPGKILDIEGNFTTANLLCGRMLNLQQLIRFCSNSNSTTISTGGKKIQPLPSSGSITWKPLMNEIRIITRFLDNQHPLLRHTAPTCQACTHNVAGLRQCSSQWLHVEGRQITQRSIRSISQSFEVAVFGSGLCAVSME